MAGIGIYLKELQEKDTLSAKIQCYGYAGIISAGPWVISMTSMLLLNMVHHYMGYMRQTDIQIFQVSMTYLIAISMILASLFQFLFGRYASDLIFQKKKFAIMPNFIGIMTINTITTSMAAMLLAYLGLSDAGPTYQILMVMNIIVLSNIWLSMCLLLGVRYYKQVAYAFLGSYLFFVLLTLAYSTIQGFLLAFLISQTMLLLGMIMFIQHEFPAARMVQSSFQTILRASYPNLLFIGPILTLGLWIDKFIFWQHPVTREPMIGNMYACIIYDLPLFIAYLTIIPGLALFLMHIETKFFQHYQAFYHAILHQKTLDQITQAHQQMLLSAKYGLYAIIKVQVGVLLLVWLFDDKILAFLQVSTLYQYLLNIHVVAASLHLILLCLINLLFYLDKRQEVLMISTLLLALNGILSYASIHLGPYYFGYGLAIALLLCCVVAFRRLDGHFRNLLKETYQSAVRQTVYTHS